MKLTEERWQMEWTQMCVWPLQPDRMRRKIAMKKQQFNFPFSDVNRREEKTHIFNYWMTGSKSSTTTYEQTS